MPSKRGLGSYTRTELRELYEKNPDCFAELAEDAIKQACMGKTPKQTLKLQQLQWTIDAQLRKAKTPRGKMHIMENIFYDQMYGRSGHLFKLSRACAEFISTLAGGEPMAKK
jgi:hypothetical protein